MEVWLSVLAAALNVVFSTWGAGHAALNKRDPRSALGWAAFCLFVPFVGAAAYATFGVNRIRTQPERLGLPHVVEISEPEDTGIALAPGFSTLRNVSSRVTSQALSFATEIVILHDGEEVYPAMLGAISTAARRIWLGSYIFDSDAVGRQFVAALAKAVDRGIDVRVLVDGVGEFYSRPRISKLMRKAGVPIARFIPPRLIPPSLHINLRNHRKLMVVDDDLVFTGGMNIGERHMLGADGRRHVQDIHFQLAGPVAQQLAAHFAQDWRFAAGEGEGSLPQLMREQDVGCIPCRVIADGPDAHLDRLPLVIEGVVSAALVTIDIVTPYFLPARPLISALRSAALKGVRVRIILPASNNLPFVHWATRHMLRELLDWDVEIYYQPAPFAHTKYLVVDGHYTLLGSANLDQRSLRLNFELGLEIYCADFGARMLADFAQTLSRSILISKSQLDQRRLPERLRDAAAWLFSPYL